MSIRKEPEPLSDVISRLHSIASWQNTNFMQLILDIELTHSLLL